MATKQSLIWAIAAALAAGGAIDPRQYEEAGSARPDGCHEVELPVSFGRDARVSADGCLLTSDHYAVRIDRVFLNPCEVDMSRSAGNCSGDGEDVLESPQRRMALTLSGIKMEGRVFDRGEGVRRLPDEGVVIEGQLPVEVSVSRTRRVMASRPWESEEVMAVECELPAQLFEAIDWQRLQA